MPAASASPDPLEVCEKAARAGGSVLHEWLGKFTASSKGPRDLVTEADHASQHEVRQILLGAFPSHGFVGEEGEGGRPPLPPGTPGHGGVGTRWIVDPLDGTTNYVHGFPFYCVSIALADEHGLAVAAIYDPLRNECFTARRGEGAWLDGKRLVAEPVVDPADAVAAVSFPAHVTPESPAVADFIAILPHVHSVRRTGSTALNLAYLAAGRLHAFWVRRICCWDAAAGILIAREAGCAVGPFAGGPDEVGLDDPGFIAASSIALLGSLRSILG